MKVLTMWGTAGLDAALASALPHPPVAIAHQGDRGALPVAPPGLEQSVTAASRLRESQGPIDGMIITLPDEPALEVNKLVTVNTYTADEYKGCRDGLRKPYRHAIALHWLAEVRPVWFVIAYESSRLLAAMARHYGIREGFNSKKAVHRFRMDDDGRYVPDGTSFLYGTSIGPTRILAESTSITEIVKEVTARD